MINLNKGQKDIVNKAIDWYKNSPEQVFQYSGNAGTGKSVVLNTIIERLNIDRNKVAPMSFIGAAAIVMRTKGLHNAKTIHSWLFNPIQSESLEKYNNYLDRPNYDLEFIPKALNGIELIIIDEAGSVPLSLRGEIESRGIKIIACGDLDQLPPVMDKPAFLYTGEVHILTEIMRQQAGSNIPSLAQRVKNGVSLNKGNYGDVIIIDREELTDNVILQYGNIICGKNNTRDYYNHHIRENILGFKSQLPEYMELLICRKNNWKLETDGVNLANGLIGHVINKPDVSSFDGKNFTIDFQPTMINGYFDSLKCDYNYFVAPMAEKNKFKYDKYNTAEKFEFAYAITTHLAQGSQFKRGIYIEEYLSPEINKNLNYTGVTRFSSGLIYVRQKKKYF